MRAFLLLLFGALLPLPLFAANTTFVQDVSTRFPATVRVLVIKPDNPRAAVVLFAGSRGVINLGLDGSTTSQNFLVRSRELFAQHKLMVAVVDAPSDRFFPAGDGEPIGLGGGFRRSAEHVQDVAAVIDFVRQQEDVPVWLVGTSRGSTSAAYVGIHLKEGGPDGIVLTSSIVIPVPPATEPTDGDSLLNNPPMDFSLLKVPALVMHHVKDGCFVTPFAGVKPLLMKLMVSSSPL
ncbi:MAG: alpha/beta hydrolase, partial [Betaproteobacteria bacterium]|nr:alpha/beta hydrolase [Betaproteobacteria bacterium]